MSKYFGFVQDLRLDSSMIDKSLGMLSNSFNYTRLFDAIEVFEYPLTHDEVMQSLLPSELKYMR